MPKTFEDVAIPPSLASLNAPIKLSTGRDNAHDSAACRTLGNKLTKIAKESVKGTMKPTLATKGIGQPKTVLSFL